MMSLTPPLTPIPPEWAPDQVDEDGTDGGDSTCYLPAFLSLWDFSGDESYAFMHEYFMSASFGGLIVLVINVSAWEEQESSVLEWMELAQARACNTPVVVIGTHIDQVTAEEAEAVMTAVKDDLKRYNISSFHVANTSPVSLAKGQSSAVSVRVEDVHWGLESVEECLRNMMMEAYVPAGFFALYDVLEKQKRSRAVPVTMRCEFEKVARLSGMTRSHHAIMAAKLLRTCGYLLTFESDPVLREVIFDPQWLSDLMKSIFPSDLATFVVPKGGALALRALPHLLRAPLFPASTHSDLLHILQQLDAIYVSIMPDKLHEEQMPEIVVTGDTGEQTADTAPSSFRRSFMEGALSHSWKQEWSGRVGAISFPYVQAQKCRSDLRALVR